MHSDPESASEEEEAPEAGMEEFEIRGLTSYQFDNIEYFLYNPHNPDHSRVRK